MKAVIFGAGHIGQGFLGLELAKSGYELVFVDAIESVVRDLNEKKKYIIEYLDESCEQVTIDVKCALHVSAATDIAKCINQSDVVVTAVGPKNIENTAKLIQEGLIGTNGKVIIAAENAPNNSWIIRDAIPVDKRYNSFYPRCTVDRIAISDSGLVKVERAFEWVIEAGCKDLGVNGVEYAKDIRRYMERKLLVLNGSHAILGFLGYNAGVTSPAVAMQDFTIRDIVVGAINEAADSVRAEYNFNSNEMAKYVNSAIQRFGNALVPDKTERLARDPIRKVSERLVRAVVLAQKHNYETPNIEKGIVAALKYDNPTDKESVLLQSEIRAKGVEFVIKEYFGLSSSQELMRRIVQEYSK